MMNKRIKALLALALAWAMTASCLSALAAEPSAADALTDTAAALTQLVAEPSVGESGGDWLIFALARSGAALPKGYVQRYYDNTVKKLAACDGKLTPDRVTQSIRVALAMTAIGKDPRNVGGYDLLAPIGDYDYTVKIGLMGPAYALLLLNAGSYTMPTLQSGRQAKAQDYVDYLLQRQLSGGGWALTGSIADPDVTAIVLQALAAWQSQSAVKSAVNAGLSVLSAQQRTDGGFQAWGYTSSESVSQVILALCQLGVPLADSRFVKSGGTLVSSLLGYYVPGAGFRHQATDADVNLIAGQQAMQALAAVRRQTAGLSPVFTISDPLTGWAGESADAGTVTVPPVTRPGATFWDIADLPERQAIEALASRGIVDGMGDGKNSFAPAATVTRGQFCAMVVRALGLTPDGSKADFFDVAAGDWFAPYVGAAAEAGIIQGVGSGRFAPTAVITRQEAAVMAARAAVLCGKNTAYSADAVRNVLAQFGDYRTVADWGKTGLAFCYDNDILDGSVLNINPTQAINRAETARMLFGLLDCAGLLTGAAA